MQLDEQLQILSEDAVNYGVSSIVMRRSVNPVLTAFARTLKHLRYHVIENNRGDWLLTTLAHRDDPKREKTVLYAFATEQDALAFQNLAVSPLNTTIVPVTHLLFQLFALDRVDSILFMEIPNNLKTAKEISRTELRASIQKQLKKLSSIPPDIA